MSTRSLAAVLAATTMFVAGGAYAADQAAGASTTPPPGHAAAVKDFGKVSADGVRGYQDLTLARLAIYDGRTADAKKYVGDADDAFGKAKNDESVFNQAEATMRSHMTKSGKAASSDNASTATATNDKAGNDKSGNDAAATKSTDGQATNGSDVSKPIAWLPVDGSIVVNEDFSAQPAKAKAVADANKSLAKGDKQGAMEKLRLAEVDTAVSLAVVPLQQTISDVDQAKQLIDSGKFYEGSQKLHAVQDSIVLTTLDVPATPAKTAAAPAGQPASH